MLRKPQTLKNTLEHTIILSWEVNNLNDDAKGPSFCRQSKQIAASFLKDCNKIAAFCDPNQDVLDCITLYIKRCSDQNCKDLRLRTTFRLSAFLQRTVDMIMMSDNAIYTSTFDLDYLHLDNHTLKLSHVILKKHNRITTQRLVARTCYNGRWFQKYNRVWALNNFSEERKGKLLQQSLYCYCYYLLFDVCFSIEEDKSVEVVRIQFTRHRDIPWKPLSVNAVITVLDAQGIESDIWKQDQHVFRFLAPKEVWQFPTFISKTPLVRQKNTYLSNDVLKLKFEFTIYLGNLSSIPTNLNRFSDEFIDTNYLEFTENMNDLYNTKRFADISLSASGESMPANKIIVQWRSTKFAEMLDDINGTDVLYLHDMTMISMKRMLKFMYTGEIDNLEYDDAVVDYVAASKYNIESLKCKYSLLLQSHLNVSNVCYILMIAEDFGDKDLKNCAMDFIEQYWESVSVSEEWESLSKERQTLAQKVKEILNLSLIVKTVQNSKTMEV